MFRSASVFTSSICLAMLVLISCPAVVTGGNRGMIENEIIGMDSLNRQAVGSLADLPRHGRVDLKADVRYEEGSPVFDIYYRKITSEKEGEIKFGGTDNADERKGGDEIYGN